MVTFLLLMFSFSRLNLAVTNLLPLTPKHTTGCFGAPGNTRHELSLICGNNEQIAIEIVEYGSKINTATNCTAGFATDRFDECCTKDTTDCNIYFEKGIEDFVNCVGHQSCNFQVTRLDNVNIIYPHCASNLKTTIYMEATYYCVPTDKSTINLAHSSVIVTSTHVYVQSVPYPGPEAFVSGLCSIETSCGASITTTVIDTTLTCQGINGEDNQYCYKANNESFIRVIEQSGDGSNFLRFFFNETGRLWIMFKSSDILSNVTVKCGSEADHNATALCMTQSTTTARIINASSTASTSQGATQYSTSQGTAQYITSQATTNTLDQKPTSFSTQNWSNVATPNTDNFTSQGITQSSTSQGATQYSTSHSYANTHHQGNISVSTSKGTTQNLSSVDIAVLPESVDEGFIAGVVIAAVVVVGILTVFSIMVIKKWCCHTHNQVAHSTN